MGRIMAIDFGQKRVGIAVTDELQIFATALETVAAREIFTFLKNYFSKNIVDTVVIGEPKQMDNTKSDSSRFIDPFVNKFKKEFPEMPLERYDERFTSKMAFQTMIDSGIGREKRKNKALVDTISATIILQSYLESKNHLKF
jgi:putative Holliday junction resolvase